jgi:hypothetical protein
VRYWKIHSEIFSISSLVNIFTSEDVDHVTIWQFAFDREISQFFAWDYIINRTLHGGLKIWLLSSRVKNIREVKIPRFRCTGTGSMILVSNIFVDVCSFTRTFFALYHCLLQENRKSMIELQTSVKQDDTTRTRTPKPRGILTSLLFYSFVALVRKILFSPLEDKSNIFAPPCNILYIFAGE